MTTDPAPLARLPQVDAVLRQPELASAIAEAGHAAVTDAVRAVLDDARTEVRAGASPPGPHEVVTAVAERLAAGRRDRLQRVINATGVLLHTNLGRAPLSTAARAAVAEASGYTNLEYDLDRGQRGSRTAAVGALAAQVCGTEAAVATNNGAAALLLVLAALSHGQEVVVSRGELIEIGGSYRLPDVMEVSGAVLREVGTTNRTRADDYRAAIGGDTGLLLKVHPSNYEVVGFTAAASAAELAALGRETGVPFVYDLGSGLLRDRGGALEREPSVAAATAAGADLVVFSGDKLLGGPQAGIVAGRADLVHRCTTHPLARAVRIDKLQRAALEATLVAHRRAFPPDDVPVWAMLAADTDHLERRARTLAGRLGAFAQAVTTAAVVGGGALPGRSLPSWGVALAVDDPARLAAGLRNEVPPIVARIEGGALVADLATVDPADDALLADRLGALLATSLPLAASDRPT